MLRFQLFLIAIQLLNPVVGPGTQESGGLSLDLPEDDGLLV